MEYKKLNHKQYLELIQKHEKSMFIYSEESDKNINECFNKLEKLLKTINVEEELKDVYNNTDFLALKSGNKKRLVFNNINNNHNIYSNLEGYYYYFKYENFEFVINTKKLWVIDKYKYTLDLSFLK